MADFRDVPMPPGVARLPRNKAGYPVPWFVAGWPDPDADFRVVDERRQREAGSRKLCWVCGGLMTRRRELAFVIGPMCSVNLVSAEPPGHVDCALYSARVCPFLTRPQMVRREGNLRLPDGASVEEVHRPAGVMIERNPGVTLVWVTDQFRADERPDGVLYRLGRARQVAWFKEGRPASRAEVQAGFEAGLPQLERLARAEGPAAQRELAAAVRAARLLWPDE